MPTHGKRSRWKDVKRLGKGGQGEVFKVIDSDAPDPFAKTIVGLATDFRNMSAQPDLATTQQKAREVAETLRRTVATEEFQGHYGALKTLHEVEDDAALQKAIERMKNEIAIYEGIDDPHLLKLLDKNLDERWLVTEYQPGGTLADEITRFQGDLVGALKAIRPIVAVLARMHKAGLVHRDVKPGNIFIGPAGQLILGDAGLVFIEADKSRISDTFENVGTRDYMPPWAMSRRVENIDARFDVFSLGKVLWAMVAGQPACPLWYVHKLEYELEILFPNNSAILFARPLLDFSVVEDPKDSASDAGMLLGRIDAWMPAMERGGQITSKRVLRLCDVCGFGRYKILHDWDDRNSMQRSTTDLERFGLGVRGGVSHAIYICDYCGHAQVFFFKRDDDSNYRPKAWRDWEA